MAELGLQRLFSSDAYFKTAKKHNAENIEDQVLANVLSAG